MIIRLGCGRWSAYKDEGPRDRPVIVLEMVLSAISRFDFTCGRLDIL